MTTEYRGMSAIELRAAARAKHSEWLESLQDEHNNPATKETISTDQQIESEIQAKGLTAPRVTPADIEANIASEHYFTAEDGFSGAYEKLFGYEAELDCSDIPDAPLELSLLTFCVLVLCNGFTVTGESACASPDNFDAEIGRKIARANAVQKIWPLMGYALKERLNKLP